MEAQLILKTHRLYC